MDKKYLSVVGAFIQAIAFTCTLLLLAIGAVLFVKAFGLDTLFLCLTIFLLICFHAAHVALFTHFCLSWSGSSGELVSLSIVCLGWNAFIHLLLTHAPALDGLVSIVLRAIIFWEYTFCLVNFITGLASLLHLYHEQSAAQLIPLTAFLHSDSESVEDGCSV